MKSKCLSNCLLLAFRAKGGRGLFLTPPLSGPLPLPYAKGLADGPIVLPNVEKGSEGCVCTIPWEAEKAPALAELSTKGTAVPPCHHEDDADWSSAAAPDSESRKNYNEIT